MNKFLNKTGLWEFLNSLTAKWIKYDNTASGLSSTTVQGAVDEVATGQGVSLPIGSVQITSTNTNPSTDLGGTWKLFDKGLKSCSYTSTQVSGSAESGVFTAIVHGRTAEISAELVMAVNPSEYASASALLATAFRHCGVTNLPFNYRGAPTTDEYGDVDERGLYRYYGGRFTIYAAASGGSITRATTFASHMTFQLTDDCIDDAYCDKFYWRKTAD